MPSALDERATFLTLPPVGYVGGLDGWELLAARMRAMRGVVALVPDPAPSATGVVLLSDGCGANNRPDIGTVVASGVDDLIPGDRVLYHPWQGTWFKPFRVGGYEVEELAVYGVNSPANADKVEMEPIGDVIPCRLVGDVFQMLGENVLIKRDPAKTTSGMFLRVDDEKKRTMKATVVAAGPRATGPSGERLEPGMRVVYHGVSIVTNLKAIGTSQGIGEDLSDHAIIKARNLYMVLDES